MNSIEIKKKLLEKGEICDHCLGRQVTLKYQGIPNADIGAALRKSDEEEQIQKILEEDDLEIEEKEDCYICKGLLTNLEDMYDKVLEEKEKWEYENFLIGCKVDEKIIDGEEEIWTDINPEDAEPIKKQINREIGKKLTGDTGKEPEFKKPDIVFILNFKENEIETQVRSLFLYGRYKKLERGIPQTKWPCTHCGGEGCEECDGTGKQFPYTVEDIIAGPLTDFTESEGTKFHGEGREDRDALMLGNGRPFVVEAVRSRKRDIDIEELQSEINEEGEGKIEIIGLRVSDMEEVRDIKSKRPDKTYEIWVETRQPVEEGNLEDIEEEIESQEIEQRTPTRVNHRRADKVRKRRVQKLETEKLGEKEFKARIRAEAGTYIKELVTGDYGRTRPSFAEVMEDKLEVEKLNVVEINESNDD